MKKLLLFVLVSAFSSTLQAEFSPTVSLVGFDGESNIVHAKQDPLLLQMMIYNSAAVSVNRANQRKNRILAQASDPELENPLDQEALTDLQESLTMDELPMFTLGSASSNIADLLVFQFLDEDGQKVEVTPSLLENYKTPKGAIQLGLEDVVYLLYAFDSAALVRLEPGKYQIAVALDTRERTAMWQGYTFSNAMEVDLYQTHPQAQWEGSSDQAQIFAHYLLANNELDLALMHTEQWTLRDPESSAAWAYFGNALAESNAPGRALEAYYTALDKYNLEYNGSPPEAARTLMKKIDALENTQ